MVPEICKTLILGIDFLTAFNFELVAQPSLEESENPITSTNLCLNYIEDYFGNDEGHICFQLTPEIPRESEPETQEGDPSLEMPTVEIPTKRIEHPHEIELSFIQEKMIKLHTRENDDIFINEKCK